MILGPVFARETVAAARQGALYRDRAQYALLMLALLAANVYGWRYWGPADPSAREARQAGWTTFGSVFGVVWILTMAVPGLVAVSLGAEAERKSLDLLLTTRLTAAEVVAGKAASALVQLGGRIAASLPILACLPFLFGIDPRLILLAVAGTATSALFMAALGACVGVGRVDVREATVAAMLVLVWIILPMPIALAMPRYAPRLYAWVEPVNTWWLASTPFAIIPNALGMIRTGSILETVAWMMGLQLGLGALLLAAAVLRLRPATRALGGDGRGFFRYKMTWKYRRLRPRPACGDDPMMWKELHTTRMDGMSQLIGLVAWAIFVVMIAAFFYFIGRPALAEALAHGYGAGEDSARLLCNHMIRMFTGIFVFMQMLIVLSFAAAALPAEKSRDTWVSLVATPLSGHEILRAKRAKAVRKSLVVTAVLLPLWAAGAAVGAVHPAGVAAASVVLVAATAFAAAAGSWASLRAEDIQKAQGVTSTLLLPLMAAPILCYLPGLNSVIPASLSPPAVAALTLASHRDVREAIRDGSCPYLTTVGMGPGLKADGGPVPVLAAYGACVAGCAALSVVLIRRTDAGFDEAVGRPKRSKAEVPPPADPVPALAVAAGAG